VCGTRFGCARGSKKQRSPVHCASVGAAMAMALCAVPFEGRREPVEPIRRALSRFHDARTGDGGDGRGR
jgi:hypothetical protein